VIAGEATVDLTLFPADRLADLLVRAHVLQCGLEADAGLLAALSAALVTDLVLAVLFATCHDLLLLSQDLKTHASIPVKATQQVFSDCLQ
jgi:hypothetical protein